MSAMDGPGTFAISMALLPWSVKAVKAICPVPGTAQRLHPLPVSLDVRTLTGGLSCGG